MKLQAILSGVALIAVGVLAGCQLSHPKVPETVEPTSKAETDPERVAVATENSVLIRRSEAGEVLMQARSESSTTSFDRKDRSDANSILKGVTGELYQKGVIVSRFRAPQGRFLQNEKILVLEDGVTITSEEKKIVMTSNSVQWKEASGLITAQGNVWLKGQGFESGPAPSLVTTPNLERFGTPDRFK